MKTLNNLKVIVIFFITITTQAQFPIIRTISYVQTRLINYSFQKGDYIQDTTNQLDSYTGTWKHIGTDKTITLKLTRVNQFLLKEPYDSPDVFYSYLDNIILTYKLEDNNGNIIVN